MQFDSGTDRRSFLTSSLAATSTALALGLCAPGLDGEQAAARAGTVEAAPLRFDALYDTSVRATRLTGEAADRLALRRLVDAWAHYADRRQAEEQSNLFVPDGAILNYEGEPSTHTPHSTIQGRAAIRTALAVLNKFTTTMHINGQSETMIEGDHAIGETYCLAHEIWTENGQRKLQTVAIRYYDQFVRQDDRWLFVERKLIADWVDTRTSNP
jgi:hypothetical protein